MIKERLPDLFRDILEIPVLWDSDPRPMLPEPAMAFLIAFGMTSTGQAETRRNLTEAANGWGAEPFVAPWPDGPRMAVESSTIVGEMSIRVRLETYPYDSPVVVGRDYLEGLVAAMSWDSTRLAFARYGLAFQAVTSLQDLPVTIDDHIMDWAVLDLRFNRSLFARDDRHPVSTIQGVRTRKL